MKFNKKHYELQLNWHESCAPAKWDQVKCQAKKHKKVHVLLIPLATMYF